MSSFKLLSLTILPDGNPTFLKILKPGKYTLYRLEDAIQCSNFPPTIFENNFYGKGISIQAIVGRNGSGKSSMLDIIYRIINNFSYFLMGGLHISNTTTPLAFVENVYAELEYEIDGAKCYLISRGHNLALFTPENRYKVGDGAFMFKNCKDYTNANERQVREVMRWFFYTIVTNYSFNAFLTSDYSNDPVYNLQGSSWIDSLFHKNDGYRTPLVFNPYRNNGQLDVQRETNFAISRIASILKYFELKQWQFIEGYSLSSLRFTYDPHYFLAKFKKALTLEDQQKLKENSKKTVESQVKLYENIILDKFAQAFTDSYSWANMIMDYYGIEPNRNDNIQFTICCYVVYKILSIAGSYTAYKEYSDYGDINNCFAIIGAVNHPFQEPEDLISLQKSLEKDTSHIAYKLHLALQFLKQVKKHNQTTDIVSGDFSYEDYIKDLLDLDSIPGNVEKIMNSFPPTIFRPTITLRNEGKDKHHMGKVYTKFTDLSAGEKLFINTISTLTYHILNIKSVPSTRIHYRRLNIIMDELELCFHPEFQRQFVNRLIQTLKRLHLNTYCTFNILLITHSPFIISDVPQNRILYLQDGIDVSDQIQVNPFGANINDVLHQSFFLRDNGFIGDYAKDVINSLVDFLLKPKNKWRNWTMPHAWYFINNIIGDGLIKDSLLQMYKKKAINLNEQ
ncbi:MAG: hypothetical protein ACRDDZ_11285 [Marinifilaceae bacterium]